MAEWLVDNRAIFALITIIGFWSHSSTDPHRRPADAAGPRRGVHDPERTKGGWYWAVCGVAALMLVWFYHS